MEVIILVVHVIAALSVLGLVLVQQGKGSDIGAAFGSGASNTMFGSAGSTSFLMKVTMAMATIFFCTSIALNYCGAHETHKVKHGILNLPSTSTQMIIPKTTLPQTTGAGKIATTKAKHSVTITK
jgi:preprotein translocase subunit SecG